MSLIREVLRPGMVLRTYILVSLIILLFLWTSR